MFIEFALREFMVPQTGALSEQTNMQQVAQPQSPPQVDIAEKLNAQGFTSTKYGEIFVWQQGNAPSSSN